MARIRRRRGPGPGRRIGPGGGLPPLEDLPGAEFRALDDAVPVLLLPVRVETVFRTVESRKKLLVRIYPDAIHVDSHDPGLTEVERDDGAVFWSRRLARGATDADREAAANDLAAQHGARRAAWIARITRPTARPGGPLGDLPGGPLGDLRTAPPIDLDPTVPRPDIPPAATDASPRAAALPARFAAIGYRDEQVVFTAWGAPVASDVRFGPAGDWAWMTDFDQAVAKGLAIEVDLAALDDVASHGLDLLLVTGVSDAGVTADAAALDELLEAHRFTDGLAFLPQGTPTNNTDKAQAGWIAGEPDAAGFVASEIDPIATAAADSNAARFGAALGIPSSTQLRRFAHATDDDEAQQRAMNRLLWPVTWGEYLGTLLAGEVSSPITVAGRSFARDWFIAKVRGGAPLPSILVGNQPYGLLPARRPVDRELGDVEVPEDHLEETLLVLREMWRDSLDGVPRMDPTRGAGTGDAAATAQEDLIAIMGSLPHFAQLAVRELEDFRSLTHDGWALFVDALSDPAGMYGGIGAMYTIQRTAGNLHSIEGQREAIEDMREHIPDFVPLENRGACGDALDFMHVMLDWYEGRIEPLDDARIPGLSIEAVQEEQVDDPTIFYSAYRDSTRIFSRALVQAEGAAAGARVIDYFRALLDDLPRVGSGPFPHDLPAAVPVRGRGARRNARRAPVDPDGRIDESGGPIGSPTLPGDLSDAFKAAEPLLYQLVDAAIPRLTESEKSLYRGALELLEDRDASTLELRLRETLGLAANRLDAWITSFARDRLDRMRASRPGGVQLGAFGWVHDLRPDRKGTSESQGFVHAPSMAHAATAAVLRSGYSARGTDEADSPLAVDLRSARVRTAAELLDGVRQGQTLGDLLGCRFERRLHDDLLDACIDPVRRAVLAADGITRGPTGPVDGMALHALNAAGGLTAVVDATTGPDRTRLLAALADVDAALDAVSDAAIAESVHQLMGGNLDRAAATLDALSTGAAPPPELRSMITPRSGVGVTHRLLVTLGEAPAASTSPRAAFDPWLEAFAASILGDPTRVICAVTLSGEAGPVSVSLADLGMSALDAVFDAPVDEVDAASAWGRRITAHVVGPGHADDVAVTFDPWAAAPDEICFGEAAQLAAALRALLARARPLSDMDLVLPGTEATAVPDAGELEDRVATLESDLRGRARTLSRLAAQEGADLAALREAMLGLAGYALPDAIPTAPARETRRAELVAQAQRLAERAATMVEALDEIRAAPPSDDRLADARALVGLILGARFPVLARLVPSSAAALDEAFHRGVAQDPLAATAWLQQAARVRAGAELLDDVLALATWLCDTPSTSVAQLPVIPGEKWVATSPPIEKTGGRLALLAVDRGGLAALATGKPIAGLVVDDWVETMPSPEQVTGVAIHFDSPAARPPQSLLLVVPPDGEEWSLDLVADTLVETLELATLRAIGPEALTAYGQHLPAIFSPEDPFR